MATDICETDPDDDSEPPKVVSDPGSQSSSANTGRLSLHGVPKRP